MWTGLAVDILHYYNNYMYLIISYLIIILIYIIYNLLKIFIYFTFNLNINYVYKIIVYHNDIYRLINTNIYNMLSAGWFVI